MRDAWCRARNGVENQPDGDPSATAEWSKPRGEEVALRPLVSGAMVGARSFKNEEIVEAWR